MPRRNPGRMQRPKSVQYLHQSTHWSDICFPVQLIPLDKLLTQPHTVLDSAATHAVVGDWPQGSDLPSLFGIHSGKFDLIANAVFRDTLTELVGPHTPHLGYSRRGDFLISVLVGESLSLPFGDGHQVLHSAITIRSAYHGKTRLNLQGCVWDDLRSDLPQIGYYKPQEAIHLTGWAMHHSSPDAYLQWLRGDSLNHLITPKQLLRPAKRGESLADLLTRLVHWTRTTPDPTLAIYTRMSRTPLATLPPLKGLQQAGVPAKLARIALERLGKNKNGLTNQKTVFDLYASINQALFWSDSSLTMDRRFALDQTVFHALNRLYLL